MFTASESSLHSRGLQLRVLKDRPGLTETAIPDNQIILPLPDCSEASQQSSTTGPVNYVELESIKSQPMESVLNRILISNLLQDAGAHQ